MQDWPPELNVSQVVKEDAATDSASASEQPKAAGGGEEQG